MQRNNKVIWVTVAIIGFIVLAGVAGISIEASEPTPHYANDRANHHAVVPNGQANHHPLTATE